jgi:hypothetical protein
VELTQGFMQCSEEIRHQVRELAKKEGITLTFEAPLDRKGLTTIVTDVANKLKLVDPSLSPRFAVIAYAALYTAANDLDFDEDGMPPYQAFQKAAQWAEASKHEIVKVAKCTKYFKRYGAKPKEIPAEKAVDGLKKAGIDIPKSVSDAAIGAHIVLMTDGTWRWSDQMETLPEKRNTELRGGKPVVRKRNSKGQYVRTR